MQSPREPLSREEYDECVTAYIEEFRNGSGSAVQETTTRLKLKHIGMDSDEIDYVIRINRPLGGSDGETSS